MDRRAFMKGAAATGLGLSALSRPAAHAGGVANLALPSLGLERPQARTPVEHLVVVMMENRSVDHYLGWYRNENPDFDATQTATFLDASGTPVATEPWGVDDRNMDGRGNYHGRGFLDPGHGWTSGRVQRNGGACDGFLAEGSGNDEYAVSTYAAADLPVWTQLVRGWQTYDRWFCSVLAPTYPNRYYLHSAQSAGMKGNAFPPEVAQDHPEWALGWDWPTIWTLLGQKGVDCAYYFSNLPFLGLWGPRHLDVTRHITEFYARAQSGTLPQVSFVDPWFITPEGLANDDHPHADLRLGQAFLSDVVEAFTSSPNYQRGAMVITYDEWGGFWDHVNPPQVADDRATPADPGGDEDFGQLGFRVPSTIVSPWTSGPGHRVDHTVYEHSSILKFISDNWGLPYLTTRHAETSSIEHGFRKFRHYDADVAFTPYEAPPELLLEPTLEDPTHPPPLPVSASAVSDLYALAETGWFDGLGVRTDWRFEDSFLDPAAIRALLPR